MAQLLDRQARLLEYLTSGGAIFRDRRNSPVDPSLLGFDIRLLDIEARFSFEKRMEKIAAVFPLTFDLLGAVKDAVLRDFADACPPHDIRRIANARQFHDFLLRRRKRTPRLPLYLSDVAACELACALVRAQAVGASMPDAASPEAYGTAIRRSPGIHLLRTAHDLRPLFEGSSTQEPVKRESLLAVALKSGAPQISELTAEVFHMLAALDRWTALDDLPGAGDLVADLVKAALLEVRR